MDFLEGLNDKQREAVVNTEGPLLILAGAGSGKTRVLTHRIAYIVEQNKVFPSNILAITFTNKAANEMKDRVRELVGNKIEGMWIGTFHSICVRILRRDIDKLGYNRSFVIYDGDDQKTLIKECIKEKGLNNEMYKEKTMINAISSLKDKMINPDSYINENYGDFYKRNVGEIYSLYQKKLKKNNALDFDDLILKTIDLLMQNSLVLEYYQKKFRYIFVDEYQDTNRAQYKLIKMLSQKYKNLCVVGDDDQCVIEGSKIVTAKGNISIEKLKENDKVYSASGRGEILEGTINKIIKKKYQGSIIKIKTKSGKIIRTTPNHIMFGKLKLESSIYYVCLIYRKDKGYKIGIIYGDKLLNDVDKLWIIKLCDNEQQAKSYEKLFYNFESKNIDDVVKLMKHLLLFEEYPHYIKTTQKVINVSFFGGTKTNPNLGWYNHQIESDNKIEKSDYDEANKYVKKLEGLNKEIKTLKTVKLTKDSCFNCMPASHIRPNMIIPVYQNEEIVEDMVEQTKVEQYSGFVYDISVPNFRQYICQDIVVHNSIYGWRGADIRNILDFEKDFPNTKIIKLEQNYRSTKNILNIANCVIKNNNERKIKKLWTRNEDGDLVGMYTAFDEKDEGEFVASRIKSLLKKGYDLSDFAILYRTNAQSRAFEEVFIKNNISYKIVGGLKFYDRKEIKDIIAYLRLIENPLDDISLKRIINVPKRGIGKATLDKIGNYTFQTGESIYSALLDVEDIPGLSKRAINNLKSFTEIINKFIAMKEVMGLKDFIEQLVNSIGYIEELQKKDEIEANTRIENLKEFISVAVDFETNNQQCTLEDFLASISLLADVDKTQDSNSSITLMTIHSAKGLEFPIVFLVGMEEGLFPISRALDNDLDLEEERRLCYVAITRAQKILYITHANVRTIYGRTTYGISSRFLKEIPSEFICKQQEKREIPILGVNKAENNDIGNDEVKVGTKVKHKMWGVGTVVQMKDKGNDMEIVVAFEQKGLKKLLLSIAPIEIL